MSGICIHGNIIKSLILEKISIPVFISERGDRRHLHEYIMHWNERGAIGERARPTFVFGAILSQMKANENDPVSSLGPIRYTLCPPLGPFVTATPRCECLCVAATAIPFIWMYIEAGH